MSTETVQWTLPEGWAIYGLDIDGAVVAQHEFWPLVTVRSGGISDSEFFQRCHRLDSILRRYQVARQQLQAEHRQRYQAQYQSFMDEIKALTESWEG